MVMMCFVLDLPSLSQPLLESLKQSLLQLANFYAISIPPPKTLSDRIGLCHLVYDRSSHSHQLNISYTPRGNFNLRDFHHAVLNLPTDAYFPQFPPPGGPLSPHSKLAALLTDEVLYSWRRNDITGKVIYLSSCLIDSVDPVLRKALLDAADKCITVDFIFLEQHSCHLSDIQDSTNAFLKQISDLENCSFQNCLPDVQILSGLVKKWLLELKEDMEEPLQVRFIFENNLLGSFNQISCILSKSVCHIAEAFNPCKVCRCHGVFLDDTVRKKKEEPSCSVTGQDLRTSDYRENCVKVGGQTILFLPSFHGCLNLPRALASIDFNVIERINLGTLSEGLMSGTSHFVSPSAYHEIDVSIDELDKSELNLQLFKGLCRVLYSLDQGLLCCSTCNLDTLRDGPLYCYYILQPSDGGPMLLRSLAGSEELLHVPHINRVNDSSVSREIEESIQASLLLMQSRDYNPILHDRGFHQTVNLLVKESTDFGSMCLLDESSIEPTVIGPDAREVPSHSNSIIDLVEVEIEELDLTAKEDNNAAKIEEWEQLFTNEIPKLHSPEGINKPLLEQSLLSPEDSWKQLEVKTSRILERLEAPRQLKSKLPSPNVKNSIKTDANVPMKNLVILDQPKSASAQGSTVTQPMRPIFQRSKRKQH